MTPARSIFFVVLCGLGFVWLTGCGSAACLPNVDGGTTPLGTIHGMNFGGHAPLAGSHIYLLEAGNSGYGSLVKSLIRSSAAGATANGSWTNSGYGSDLFVPAADATGNPFYGLTADSLGSFTLTGDYTCDVGRVVYLLGVGGNPGTSGTASAPTQVGYFTTGSGASETATVLVAYSGINPNVGDIIRFSGQSGSLAGLSGQTGPVSSIPIAGTLFAVTIADANGGVLPTNTGGTTYFTGLGTVQSTPFNHAAVNAAVLGTCPASGTFAASVPYIYMNEVSTVAAAYALAAYNNGSSGLTNQSGLDAFHIGSSATALGLQGIKNAAANAANLYDITGTNAQTPAHNALSTTPTNTNGTAPQAELDTLANVLASCVDSCNNYRGGLGTLQASCQTLFQYASSNGVYDTSSGNSWTLSTSKDAFNTFQAAVNMARFPQGAGVGSTTSGTQTITTAFSTTTASNYASGLYALETGTVPFTPNLHSTSAGAPNSFLVAIEITGLTNVVTLGIDGSGSVWVVTNYIGTTLSKFSSSGTALANFTGNGLDVASSISFDGSGNAWVANAGGSSVSEFSNSGTALLYVTSNSNGLASPQGLTIDGSGNVWMSNSADSFVSEFSNSGTALLNFNGNGLSSPEGIAIDGSGNVWVANEGGNSVSKFSNSGTSLLDLTGNGLSTPEGIAIDGSGNAWVANNGGGSVSKFSNSGTSLLDLTVAGSPSEIVIDGSGNAWVASPDNNSMFELSSSGATLLFSYPWVLNSIAVDGSGDVWGTDDGNDSLVEFIGAAPPVITPLCAGLPSTPSSGGVSNLGTRP